MLKVLSRKSITATRVYNVAKEVFKVALKDRPNASEIASHSSLQYAEGELDRALIWRVRREELNDEFNLLDNLSSLSRHKGSCRRLVPALALLSEEASPGRSCMNFRKISSRQRLM